MRLYLRDASTRRRPSKTLWLTGFSTVNVFAVLHRPDGGQGVPVVRRGDCDDVDLFVFDDLAQILFVFGLPLVFRNLRHSLLDDAFVGVANGRDNAAVLIGQTADMVHTAAIDADDGDAKLVIGGDFRSGLGAWIIGIGTRN